MVKRKPGWFARKYGVKGRGVRTSKRTTMIIESLIRQGEHAIKQGKYWAKTCNQRFG